MLPGFFSFLFFPLPDYFRGWSGRGPAILDDLGFVMGRQDGRLSLRVGMVQSNHEMSRIYYARM